MALPKDYHWREGDKVSLTATVKHGWRDEDCDVFVEIDGRRGDILVGPEHVDLLQARVNAGDFVYDKDSECSGTVVAVNDLYAWIKLRNSGENAKPVTSRLADLEVQPQPQEDEDAAAAPDVKAA